MTNEELVQLYQAGDKQALNDLIEENTGIVYKLVNKFYIEKTNSIDKEDLEQEGYIGLMIAAERYDFNNPKKAQFMTYAIHWVYSKISRYINQRNTNEETSLNTPIGEDGNTEIVDYIEGIDYGFENVEEKLYNKQLRREIEETMNRYNTLQEREVLKLRYGWDNNNPASLYEIGDMFKISGERVRQIGSRAMRKLRNTPWGQNKAKELYINKARESKYNVNKSIESINFADKYLCDEVI